jgi:hypothetical protein
MNYRVLMQDTVNGQAFNFAMVYEACTPNGASDSAIAEFPEATVVSITVVQPNLGELLQQAIDKIAVEELLQRVA